MNGELVFDRHESMTDYTKLVEALRYCAETPEEEKDCNLCEYYPKCSDVIAKDAADAIEDLLESVGMLDQQRSYWIDKAAEYYNQLPKRGEWLIHSTGGSMAIKKCPFCGSESWQSKEYAKVPKYCQNCGAHLPTFKIMDWVDYLYAKMEAQDGANRGF